MDISRPDKCTVTLAAGPGTADKINDIFLSFCGHAVKKGLRIHDGIDIACLQCRSGMITVIVKFIFGILRLCLIKPEYLDPLVVVIFLHDLPEMIARARMSRIIEHCIAHPVHHNRIPSVETHEIPFSSHLGKVLRGLVHCRPNGYHQLNPHLPEFLHHCFRVRPVIGIKFPISLLRPMEEVNDNN